MKAINEKIVVILPRGEAIRNFVYTNCLDELEKYRELHVISVLPSEEITDLLKKKYSNIYPLISLETAWIVRFTREILDMAHGRKLWSEAAKQRWKLRDIESKTVIQKVKRNTKKLIAYLFIFNAGLQFLEFLEHKLSCVFIKGNHWKDLLKKIKPSLVFNGSHIHSKDAISVVHAAKSLKIKTAAFIFSWDNLTSQGRIVPTYDHYIVWNRSIKNQLLSIYPNVHNRDVSITGTPQFDFHFRKEFHWSREKLCKEIGMDPDQKFILYSTGMPHHMPGEEKIIECIADELKKIDACEKLKLVVRVYGKDDTNRFDELKKRRKDILFPKTPWLYEAKTPEYVDCYLWTNMLKYCDGGINIASTVTLELCMFNKPIINIAYDPPHIDISPIHFKNYYNFDHYKPITQSGAVEVVKSQNSLKQIMNEILVNPRERLNNQKKLIDSFFEKTLDGKVSERIAKRVLDLT